MKALLIVSVLLSTFLAAAHADDSFTVIMNNKTYTCSEGGGGSAATCRVLVNGDKALDYTCGLGVTCAVLIKYGVVTNTMMTFSAADAAAQCDKWLGQ